jgi:DnaJ-like protein
VGTCIASVTQARGSLLATADFLLAVHNLKRSATDRSRTYAGSFRGGVMQGREPSLGAARALLGLADGADRAAVVHAYRRLAQATHPDRSDAPDAAARFDAITAAYRRALDGTGVDVPEPPATPPASPTVRITVHTTRDDPSPRTARWTVGRPVLFIGDPTVVDPPIVAGPVRVSPPSSYLRGARPDRRGG